MSQIHEPVTISIRAKAGQRDLIDQAADRLGRSRSDFMLEAACRRAEDVLLDQTYFALEAKGFSAFQAMLDTFDDLGGFDFRPKTNLYWPMIGGQIMQCSHPGPAAGKITPRGCPPPSERNRALQPW